MSNLRHLTLGQLLEDTTAKTPDTEAVVYVDRDFRLTYREFNELTDVVAKGLMALGVKKGEKVAVWANNVPYWVALQFATAKIGAILLTVNTHYRSHEFKYLLEHSETENLFLIGQYRDHDYLETTYELIPELRSQERGHLKTNRFPHLKRVFYLGHEKHRGMYSIPELQAMAAMVTDEQFEARKAELDPHDVVNMQYTSGTTGFPKGVQLTHYNIVNNGYWIGANQHFHAGGRLCLPVPLFHCFGCVLGVMAAVNHGVTMVLLEDFSPLEVMAAIDQEKCTAVYGVPTMFISILDHPLFERFDYSSLRTGIMAGSPCPITAMKKVMDLMNMKDITICYGLTEGSPVMSQTVVGDSLEHMTETVGQHMPEIEVKIVDPDTGKDCPTRVTGEICCRGYNVMKGYYNNEKATAEAIDANGWLHSGDLGMLDEDGYLYITGRLKDMIIRGGENIYPRELEEFLYTMDGVLDVQVAGVPSKKFGEQVGAFVILKEGATLLPEDVIDFCRGKISRYKIPKYVTFLDTYPMTASGKIQKYKLREMAAELWPDA